MAPMLSRIAEPSNSGSPRNIRPIIIDDPTNASTVANRMTTRNKFTAARADQRTLPQRSPSNAFNVAARPTVAAAIQSTTSAGNV